MRKISKVPNKKVFIPEEDEEEKYRKTESKKAIIRADFEKHKKELILNVSDASKMNEIRLKNQLEELLTSNNRKRQDLQRLESSDINLERQMMEDTQFFDTVNKNNTSKASDAYLSVGFHPSRTTSTLLGLTEKKAAESLGDKKTELLDTLSNIELMIEQEDEMVRSVQEKYEELKRNQILINKKTNEMKKMNEHADRRFTDLQRVEFLAKNKHAAAAGDLKELKDNIRELKNQEFTYMKQKDDQKKKDVDFVNFKQTEISNVLIEIDNRKHEYLQKLEELKKAEDQYNEMRDKRKTTKTVTEYIETLNSLINKKEDLLVAHQTLKQQFQRSSRSKEASPDKRASTIEVSQLHPSLRDGLAQRFKQAEGDEKHTKRNSLVDRSGYVELIQKFYEAHPEGPQAFVDNMISQYLDESFREKSLKINYEELQNLKIKQENELQLLQTELYQLRSKNEYITLGRTGSKILDKNSNEAIDSGMLIVETNQTTLNQAKFEFENRRDADNHAVLFTNTETFVLRCYLDSIEMISRLSKVLQSIYNQSGGYLHDDLKDLARSIYLQVNLLKKPKRGKIELSVSHTFSEAAEPTRAQTGNTSASEKEIESLFTLDLAEVYDAFLMTFEGYFEKAKEFVDRVKSDVMTASFISIDDIRNFLQKYQNDYNVDVQIEKMFKKMNELRRISIENMLHKLETIYKMYPELINLLDSLTIETCQYLREKGIEESVGDIMKRKNEQTEFVKRALEKKWQNLLEKYDYDPNSQFRKGSVEDDHSNDNNSGIQKVTIDDSDLEHKEAWDNEDLRAKLNEITGSTMKKSRKDFHVSSIKGTYKSKHDEDQERLQAKKDKEKQKQFVENMTDDDFLDWQRKQIKDVKEDLFVSETSEGQLLRKAQADQASRLSQTVHLDELKRMIENSKVLSKIQILEKQKCVTDVSKSNKFNSVDNYIPLEPKIVPKSPSTTYMAATSPDWKIRISRNAYTPAGKTSHNRLFPASSDRMTDSELSDSPKERSFKGKYPKALSKFKPQDLSDFNTEPTQEHEKPHTQGSKRLMTFEHKIRSDEDYEDARGSKKMPRLDEKSERVNKKNKILMGSMRKKLKNGGANQVRTKSTGVDLPKLDKPLKKKWSSHKKSHKDHNRKTSETENLNLLLSLQTDPLLKMVYSPSYFAPALPSSALGDALGYKFDAYKFKAPSLLVSEKLSPN